MFGSTIVDLRRKQSWDVARLAAEAFVWPVDWPLVSLGEVASVIYPSTTPTEGAFVITPGGLDARTGGVRRRTDKYLGNVFQVGPGEYGLRPGDLLVPPTPGSPVVFVTDALQGSLVSGAFTALRVAICADWVWGVLNSSNGKRLRAMGSTASAALPGKRTSLLELRIPWAPAEKRRAVEPTLRSFVAQSIGDEDEAPTSWWRVTDLRTSEWRFALATSRPELLNKGFRLAELVADVRSGRPDSTYPLSSERRPGDLPVADAAWLRSGKIRRWCSPESSRATILTRESDVVMAAYGASAFAVVAPAGFVIDTSVFALSLVDRGLASGVARYLNSRTGRGTRALRLTGTTMQRLGLRDVRELRVTEQIYDPVDDMDSGPLPPLEDRLEQVLWT